ncbi:hypothetical protein AAFF_G00301570 [Aldrovandia affinis]|uniref:Semaphorin-7A-like n=1 Tax=Aldrovandia affinis TaxID=143900 RepID=A0AAD7SQ58_9TELE|nr:hypothetical protein AAFF_G00301570 [Aldrovandia affinis]
MFITRWIIFVLLKHFPLNVTGSHHDPRVTLTGEDVHVRRYSLNCSNRRIELLPGFPQNNSVYVGGHGKLWYLNFNRRNQSKKATFPALERKRSDRKPTAPGNYDVTTLHRVDATRLFVCGSNGNQPKCCLMTLDMVCIEDISPSGIAPFNVTERAPSLYIDNDVYAAVSREAKQNSVAIRRIGNKTHMWPEIAKQEQRYISMAFSGPREDQLQDKVYTFLVQESSDNHPEASAWNSWVTQVCKADMGGPKTMLQKSWTSRLSARLSCGIHDRKEYFNQLLDVAVLQADNWTQSRVYGLFRNGWGMTAICIYTMGDIDHVFKNSDFEGFTGAVPNPRPGEQCVKDSTKLPQKVLSHVKEYPNMRDWVWPVGRGGPLMVSHHDYKGIRADRVRGPGHKHYNVLLLSLDNGRIHKVLEHDAGVFIIAELQPFSTRTRIQNMLLQHSTKKLYVSSSSEVVEVDLSGCQSYGSLCVDCVQARDPYCSWSRTHCTATSRKGIQDVEHGNVSVCGQDGGSVPKPSGKKVEILPLASNHYLHCPMSSSHAEYSWRHGGQARECVPANGSCLLLINSMTSEEDGVYTCVASEGGYTRTLAEYRLQAESKARGLTPPSLALACLLLLLLIR